MGRVDQTSPGGARDAAVSRFRFERLDVQSGSSQLANLPDVRLPEASAQRAPWRLRQDGKVVRGKDWLFLANDSNEVVRQHAGELRFSEDQVRQWRRVLEDRVDWLSKLGGHYFFMSPPDTHAVYPERLPDGYASTKERPVCQLIHHLEKTGSPARFIYPLDELLAHKTIAPVCSPVGSHWNDFGAFIAYITFLDQLEGVVPFHRVLPEDVLFFEALASGDLSYKIDTELRGKDVFARLDPNAELVHDNCIDNTGELVVLECGSAPPTSCLVMGDSYSIYMLPFLAESFGRVVLGSMDRDLVEQERPDVVLTVVSERCLIAVPEDDKRPSLRELEARKKAEGRIRRRLPFWDTTVMVPPLSVETVERIRAHLLSADDHRSAALVCVLAYAGLYPDEACRLRWSDVGDDTLSVPAPEAGNSEQGGLRSVPLFEPLAEDLESWRLASGDDTELIFANRQGGAFTGKDWLEWRDAVYVPAARACGVHASLPRNLAHTFRSLVIREGKSTAEVLQQTATLGGPPYGAYAMVFNELEEQGPLPAAAQIEVARERVASAARA